MKAQINMSDEELIEKSLSGDMEAFGMIVDRYKDRINGFIYRSIYNKETAEDIFQETFYKAIKALPSYKHKGKFISWIYSIANNLIIDKARRAKYDSHESLDSANDQREFMNKTCFSPVEYEMEQKEKKRIMENALSLLPLDQRQVVLLRTESELSFKEISRILNCPLNTVLSRMHKATESIRKSIENLQNKEVII